ncbi:unnamed protein product, partial [Meganyctiphanes norvegica]
MSETSEALLFVNGQAVLLTSNGKEDIVQKVLTNNVVSENLNSTCTPITVNSHNDEVHINNKEGQVKEQDGIQHIQIQYQNVSYELQEEGQELHQSGKIERGIKLPLNELQMQYDTQKKQTLDVSTIHSDMQNNSSSDEPRIHDIQEKLPIENQEVKFICWSDSSDKDKQKLLNLKEKYNSNYVIKEVDKKQVKHMSNLVEKDNNISVGINTFDNNVSMTPQIYLKANEFFSEDSGLNDFNKVDRDEMSDTNIYIVSTDEDILQSSIESNVSVQKIDNNSSCNEKREFKTYTLEELPSKANFIEQKGNFVESSNTANLIQHIKKESGQYSSPVNDIHQSNKTVDIPVNSNKREGLVAQSHNSNISSIIAMLQTEDGGTQTIELSSEEAQQLGIFLPNSFDASDEKQSNYSKKKLNENEKNYNNMNFDNEQKSHSDSNTDSNDLVQLPINSSSSAKNRLLSEQLLIIPDLNSEGSISMIKVNESQENEKLLNVNMSNFSESKTELLHKLSESLTRSNVNSGSFTYNNIEDTNIRPSLSKENSSVKTNKLLLKNSTPYIQQTFQVRQNEKKANLQKIATFSEKSLEMSKGIKLLNPSIPGSSQNAKSILQRKSFTHINKPTTSKKMLYQKGIISEKNIISMEKNTHSINLSNPKSLNDIDNEIDNEIDKLNTSSSEHIYTDNVLIDSEMNNYQIYSINGKEQLGIVEKMALQDTSTALKWKNSFIENINFKENTKKGNNNEINEFIDNFSHSKNQSEMKALGKTIKIEVSTGTTFDGQESEHDYNTKEDSTSLTTSIECTEIPEEILGLDYDESHEYAQPPSVTSIVYCAPGIGEAPLTVHLPAGNNTKPLGSSENPIQLVQQGQTFQALQPVQEKQLEQITTLLQQRQISAPPSHNHQEIYDPKTNMKIVYKVVYPSDIAGMQSDEEDECVDVEGCYTTWSNIEAEPYIVRPRGRPNNKFRKAEEISTGTM